MTGPREKHRRYVFIGFCVILMAVAIFVGGESLHVTRESPKQGNAARKSEKEAPILAEAGMFRGQDQTSRLILGDPRFSRSLADYYARRAYPGAPPSIPHPIESDMNAAANACQACHLEGGFVPRFQAYAPVTPHADFQNCRQCHVPSTDAAVFQGQLWQSIDPPPLGRTALPGGPPPIPHALRLREKCSACHTGPAAIREIRTSHPERIYCRQCHVPAEGQEPYVRGAEGG